jgi:membrane associated rhomboid family serine protease
MQGIAFAGIFLEWSIGPWFLFLIYNLCILSGNLTFGWVDIDNFGYGASAAIYGFIGAYLGRILIQANGMRADVIWTAYIPIAIFTLTVLVK